MNYGTVVLNVSLRFTFVPHFPVHMITHFTCLIVEYIEVDETNRTICFKVIKGQGQGQEAVKVPKINNFKIYFLSHLVSYHLVRYVISQTCPAIFSNFGFGFGFVLWPSEFGSDGVFTRILEGPKSVQRCRSSDWMVTMDITRYCLLESCNTPPP